MSDSREIATLYKRLPAVDDLLRSEAIAPLLTSFPRSSIVSAIRVVSQSLRDRIRAGELSAEDIDAEVHALAHAVSDHLRSLHRYSLTPVLNGTGVLLHTNLGRAPLSEQALDHVVAVSRGYSNLELDLRSGLRSKREVHAEHLLLRVLAARAELPVEDFSANHRALFVNNCAAATFLVLNSLAEDKEVIVSRGELLEIGGGFRIPDILEKSGAVLKEVGTTNRTRASDYARAVNANTALLLRVHAANFKMIGFVEKPTRQELLDLAQPPAVLYEDQGTGCLLSLQEYGIQDEETLTDSLRAGVHVVSASGDKLLGGPQCGIIVGRSPIVEKIACNPLLRALRMDKLSYAALEGTLHQYLGQENPDLPLTRMLRYTVEELRSRADRILHQMQQGIHTSALSVNVVPDTSLIGGGTTPGATLNTILLVLKHAGLSANALAARMRAFAVPVVPRTFKDAVALDLRTLPPDTDELLMQQLNSLSEPPDQDARIEA